MSQEQQSGYIFNKICRRMRFFTGLVYINSELYGSLDCAQRTKLHELSFKIDVR